MSVKIRNTKTLGHMLAPDANTVRTIVRGLRKRAASNPSLRAKWQKNPRSVLADAGLNVVVQKQILEEEGFRVRWTPQEKAVAEKCYGCSQCCCTSCSWT